MARFDERDSDVRAKYHNVSGSQLRDLLDEGSISLADWQRAMYGTTFDPTTGKYNGTFDQAMWGTTAPPVYAYLGRDPNEMGDNIGGAHTFNLGGTEMERLGAPHLSDNAINASDYDQYIKFDPTYGYYMPKSIRDSVKFKGDSFTDILPGLAMASMGGLAAMHSGLFGAASGASNAASSAGSSAGGGAGITGGSGGGFGGLGSLPTDFSLVPQGSGLGIGGVGTGGLGLQTAGLGVSGLTPEMIAAGGGAGAFGAGGLGLNTAGIGLTPGLISAGGGAAAMGLPGGLTIGGGQAAGGGLWDSFSKMLFGNNGAGSALGQAASSLVPTGNAGGGLLGLLGSLYGAYQNDKQSDKYMDLMREAINRSDPFGGQRGFYQDQLKQSYTDPNYFDNNATFKGIRDIAINDTGRQMAAQGYNGSGNMLSEIASRINKEGMNYALQFQNQTGNFAGAQFSPQGAGNLGAQAAQQNMTNNNNTQGYLGNALARVPELMSTIGSLT